MRLHNLGDIRVIRCVEPLLLNSVPPSQRVVRRFPENAVREFARKLTELMVNRRPFSFIRMGDREAALLLVEQETCPGVEWGPPGLSRSAVQRLRLAYENASYVDFGERIWMLRGLVPHLTLKRSPSAYTNTSESDSHIFTDWFRYEFKSYCSGGRRCLFVGAEARLLEQLFHSGEYRWRAEDYWPEDSTFFFLEESSTTDTELDGLKRRIVSFIREQAIDTVFICLGAAAKILCHELAAETGTCAFDAGSIMRALTFCGSDGNRGRISDHHPFLLHVPFSVHMAAVRRAWPEMAPARILEKAQCQVLRELCEQVAGESSQLPHCLAAASPERQEAFRLTLAKYKSSYRALKDASQDARRAARDFDTKCAELVFSGQWWWPVAHRTRNTFSRVRATFNSAQD